MLKYLLIDDVFFFENIFIHMELLIEESLFEVPPVVYAYLLSLLCHYHLNNVQECKTSLGNLQLTITEKYFLGKEVYLKA